MPGLALVIFVVVPERTTFSLAVPEDALCVALPEYLPVMVLVLIE